ncbi:hypothetical protein LEP1GSC041_0052 [Leptospira noguchii str. 2006001870]|nr:hypothetical protein LEP1GSC041_0052 [Leptospira noguchii str. 2006001870]
MFKNVETHAKTEKPVVYNAMQNVGLPRFNFEKTHRAISLYLNNKSKRIHFS